MAAPTRLHRVARRGARALSAAVADPFCSSTVAAPHATYPRLFEPLTLPCGLTLRNRTLMGSMHTGLEERRTAGGLEEMAAFYAERAAGGAGIIVTGGVAPNREGWVLPFAGKLATPGEAARHRCVTDAVHDEGGAIAMQILHAGRYAYHPFAVGPSTKKAPINVVAPRALGDADVSRTVDDFAACAELARSCGYDGVEVMGSEGYLINEFLAPRTNDRTDRWGGSFENRSRLAVEVARAVRRAAGDAFAIIFRLSMLELVDGGMTFDETVDLAEKLRDAGVDVVNTGIGWHEARVPTIATSVPRAAFAFATRNVKDAVEARGGAAPLLCATNRVNDAATCEALLDRGDCDLVSMARPFLADAALVAKAFDGRENETNTCIACNQACLDHTFKMMPVSCLVNPRAGHETSLNLAPAAEPLAVAVAGGGVAGLAAAEALASRGHRVTLFEKSDRLGGQFVLAARVPGKGEFVETLRYFEARLDVLGVDVRLGTAADARAVAGYDRVVVATGVRPRGVPGLASAGAVAVRSYADVLRAGAAPCGPRVAVVGAGGIGFDVAEFLTAPGPEPPLGSPEALDHFCAEWGIDRSATSPAGLVAPSAPPPPREVYLLQRKPGPLGAGLGKTTGWIHRAALKQRGVEFVRGVEYGAVRDDGFHVTVRGEPRVLDVTDVVVCAGQESEAQLFHALKNDGAAPDAYAIGGAEKAGELDAKRAIDQAVRLASQIETAPPGSVYEMPVGWQADALRVVARLAGKKV